MRKALGRGAMRCLVALSFALAAPSVLADQTLAPATVDDASLAPGLAVDYYYGYFRWIDGLVEKIGEEAPEPGTPLPLLDYQTGTDEVLTSGRRDGVGARIRGFMRLDAGTYTLVVQSNDGVRITLGGMQVLEDPDVHSDRYSNPVTVVAPTAGWYPLEVLYFERKNTSTLRLLWRRPQDAPDARMTVVPASAYRHLAGG